MMMVPIVPQPLPGLAGGGGSGSVGLMPPITSPGLQGLNVSASLWMLATFSGICRIWPCTKVPLPVRLLAWAIRYHRVASPQTFLAMLLRVSLVRTVQAVPVAAG